MAKQEIKNIKVRELHLWSENPRDPIDTISSDFDIIKRAIDDNPKEWNLDRLVKEMGKYYDFSEIPTIVYINEKPVVFDGNRRVAILKYFQDRALFSSLTGKLPFGDGPKELRELVEIPCNVCDKDTALTNIERKHVNSGSWGTLQREYFLHQHRGQPKSIFLVLEEQSGLISAFPSLNQGFVKDEVLTEKNLKDIGFSIQDEEIISNYNNEEQSREILEKISSLIENKDITTRKSRGKLKQALIAKYPDSEEIIVAFNDKKPKRVIKYDFGGANDAIKRRTPITKQEAILFGKKLGLKNGPVNDLYCGICAVYERFDGQEHILPIIAMSLRLLLDTAARAHFIEQGDDASAEEDDAYKNFLKEAKKCLNKQKENSLTLNNEWLSNQRNLDAVLGKYAHGNITYKQGDILKDSIIIADILEYYFKKNK
jgi:hypothetical protein